MKPTESLTIDEDESFLVGYANASSVPSAHITSIIGPIIVAQDQLYEVLRIIFNKSVANVYEVNFRF